MLCPLMFQPSNTPLVPVPPPPPPPLGLIVITRVAVPVPELFVAEIDTFDVPASVGVPVIVPEAFTLNPAGKPVTPNAIGLPVAVI